MNDINLIRYINYTADSQDNYQHRSDGGGSIISSTEYLLLWLLMVVRRKQRPKSLVIFWSVSLSGPALFFASFSLSLLFPRKSEDAGRCFYLFHCNSNPPPPPPPLMMIRL